MGGYVKSVPNKKLKINRIAEEELNTLREICNEARPNGTVRQLARAMARTIYRIAAQLGYPGHLYKALKAHKPELNTADAYFACEVYSGFNYTPHIIEEALALRTQARKAKTIKPKQNKGKKKKGR